MPVLMYRFYDEVTPASGSWSGDTASALYGYRMAPYFIRHLVVRAATSSTTFNLYLKDAEGFILRSWLNCTGVINDLTPTPIKGPITVEITGASADELFKVYIMFADQG